MGQFTFCIDLRCPPRIRVQVNGAEKHPKLFFRCLKFMRFRWTHQHGWQGRLTSCIEELWFSVALTQ